MKAASTTDLPALQIRWRDAWPVALNIWSKFTRLRPPTLCLTPQEAQHEGLTGSFAMIRLQDQSVVVSLPAVAAAKVDDFAVEVLAHEIGHHVLAPSTLTDHTRMIARMRWSLPTVEYHAPMVANLYTDLLINDRLQRNDNLRIAEVYRALSSPATGGAVWALYVRMYELLWSLPRGSLGGGATDAALDGDAWLGMRLVRSYARDWLDGSGRFAALLLPHLLQDEKSQSLIEQWYDTQHAAAGGQPAGVVNEEPNERTGAIHPARDPALTGEEDVPQELDIADVRPTEVAQNTPAQGQARQPFEYGEILRASGVDISDHDAAVQYYRERALPHLIPFPSRCRPDSKDPLPEGLEPWDIGHALDDADWFQTVLQSPRVVPGLTTVQRVWGTSEGREPERRPIDLDLYVDCSGSMPNPQRLISFPALAGAILCLSALRAGARVQATLWSGKHEVKDTDGFVRDEQSVLRVLTGYFGGGTAFPIHALRDTYAKRNERPVHILVISDEGISTMFDQDERGNSGWNIAAAALEQARGGGTFVLNLPYGWDQHDNYNEKSRDPFSVIRRARDEQDWHVHRISSWEDLVVFAREFSRLKYTEATA